MASQEDTDDLYADLYGGDGSGDVVDLGGDDKAHASDEQDLIGYDEEDNKNNNDSNNNGDNNNGDNNNETSDEKPSGASNTGSFIPPPSAAPSQQADAGLQIKGSFIPPAAASQQAHSQSDVRDLTPASHNDVSNNQHDGSYGQGQGDGQGSEGAGDRSVMPHEMPEEG